MESLSEERFVELANEFDAAVEETEDLDTFCSSTDWVMPAHRDLMPARRFVGARLDGLWFVGALRELGDGIRVLEPLEASWALASPAVGLDSRERAACLVQWLMKGSSEWDVLLIAGMTTGSRSLGLLTGELERHFELRIGEPTPRYVIDLGPGVDAFLSRRSKNFRRSITKARNRWQREGITFEPAHAQSSNEADAIYQRVLAVERRSWKGVEGVGIDDGHMSDFYRHMGQRLARDGRHRCWFARLGERDLGYVLGGVRGSHYRGLQFSYDREVSKLSLGNVMQVEQMLALSAEGIRSYDLGSQAEYKRRWADEVVTSPVLFCFKRR